MSYIRKVKTASGATAIQILTKYHGQIIKIDHIGSAHTNREVKALEKLAHDKLKPKNQGNLLDLISKP